MQAFKELINGKFVKIFVALIVAAFILSGLTGFMEGSQDPAVIKLKGDKITFSQINKKISVASRSLYMQSSVANGGKVDADTLAYLSSDDFKQNILRELLQTTLINRYADYVGLRPSNAYVIQHAIIDNPDFHDDEGKFDAESFQRMLQYAEVSEDDLIQELHKEMAGNLLLSTLIGESVQGDKSIIQDFYRFEMEERVADILIADKRSVTRQPVLPEEEELKKFYQDNPHLFQLPELRSFDYLVFTPETIAGEIKISDAEIKEYYEQNINRFHTPESRDFYVFATQDGRQLEELSNRVSNGEPLEVVSRDIFRRPLADLQRHMTREELGGEFAQVVFELTPEKLSEVVEGSSNTKFMFYVTKVQSAQQTSLAKAKTQIFQELLRERQGKSVDALAEEIDNLALEVENLAEMAKRFKLQVHTVELVDETGRDVYRQANGAVQPLVNHLPEIFSLDQHQFSSLIYDETKNVYYIAEVKDIQEAKLLDFASSREMVKKQWLQQAMDDAIMAVLQQAKAEATTDNLAALARKYHLKLARRVNFKRFDNGKNPYFVASMVDELYQLSPTGKARSTKVVQSDKQQYQFAMLQQVKEPATDAQSGLGRFQYLFVNDMQKEIFNAFENYLYNRFRAHTDEDMLKYIMGQ